MAFIEIVKQPTYGSVYWNSIDFVYTPNEGYTGNDSFTYKKIEGDKTYLYTKFVNASNTPPIASNVSLTANVNQTLTFSLSDLAYDSTNPFGVFRIDSVTNSKYGSVQTDGVNIYYEAPYFNCSEIIYFNVSDSQFLTTGSISLSVINGVDPENYKGTFENRLTKAYDLLNSFREVSSNYDNSYIFLSTNKDYLNSINPYRWIYLYNYVSSASASLIDLYNKLQEFTDLYNILSSSSASWITNIDPLSALDNRKGDFYNTYNIISSISSNWENNITNFYTLCSEIISIKDKHLTTSQTVTNNITNWDTQESNIALTGSNIDKWNDTYQYVNFYKPVWDAIYNLTNSFSTFYYDNNLLFNPSYEVLNNNYVDWINTLSSFRTTLSENSAFWDIIYSKKQEYDNLYDNIQYNSNEWITDTATSEFIKNLMDSNSNNWNSYSDTIFQKYNKWNGASPLSSEISKHIPDLNSFDETVQSNYSTTWKSDIARTLLNLSSSNWNSLYSIVSNEYTQNWNSLYFKTTSFYEKYNEDKNNFNSIDVNAIDSISNKSENVTNILRNNSANLVEEYNLLSGSYTSDLNNFHSTISNLSTDFNTNKNNFNNTNDFVNEKYSSWSNNSINSLNLSSVYWNSVFNEKTNYDNTYTIVSSKSSNWGVINNIDDLNNHLNSLSTNWNTSFDYINLSAEKLDSVLVYTQQVSTNLNDKENNYNDISLLVSSYSSVWSGEILKEFDNSSISKFESDYDLLLNRPESQEWDNFYLLINSYSAFYNDSKTLFDSACSTVLDKYTQWSSTTALALVSSSSAKWDSTYNNLTSLSNDWFFNEKINYLNSYSTTSSVSSRLNYWNNTIQTYSGDWNMSLSLLAPLTADALSGSSLRSLSTKNINVFGNSLFKNNISAFGGVTRINSDVIKVSSYTVTNDGTNNAVTVLKNGGYNALLNFKYQDNTILYVKCENSTVWINLSGQPIGKALNIVGNISASGYVYPLFDSTINIYTSKSANYENTYSLITSNSASIEGFNLENPKYISFNTYYTSNSADLLGIKTRTYYNNFYNSVTAQSALNKTITDYISLCSDNFTKDTVFRDISAKYDTLYTYVSSSSSLYYEEFEIFNVINYNNTVQNQSFVYYVQEDIEILSWYAYSEIPTSSTINILSSFYNNYSNSISIVGSNPIKLDNTNPNKNTRNNLAVQDNWITNINKNSVLKFVLTTNTAASSILINLKVKKR